MHSFLRFPGSRARLSPVVIGGNPSPVSPRTQTLKDVTILEMFDLRLEFADRTTQVVVRTNVLRDVGTLIREALADAVPPLVVVFTDDRVGPLYNDTVRDALNRAGLASISHQVPAGEVSKNLAVAEDIYRTLADREVSRDAVILALGGGVVSDLAGFVAATWMRGVRFVICPTTLEADLDASVGGKTAINIPGGKNLVGAFHQPVLVAVDPTCLKTLDMRDVRAGLAESVKHALIASPDFLDWHEDNVERIIALDQAVLTELIRRNLEIKGDVVTRDAKEQADVRVMLNLGHTIGHAIEECCGYAMRHGECVSLGLLAACRLSHSMGLLAGPVVSRVEGLLKRFGLPTMLADPIDTGRILATIRKDKKVQQRESRFVLLEDVGRPIIRGNVGEPAIRQAYESLLR